MNPTVGDVEGNARQIVGAIESARRAGADLVVLPELCVCGYPPRDLLLQEGFVAACVSAAKRVGEEHTAGITAIFGVPLPVEGERAGGLVANGLVAYRDGKLVGRYDKRLLPTYDVFDEDRYFTPGARAEVVEVETRGGGRVRVGLSICEDLWRGDDAGFSSHYRGAPDPVEELVRAGAEVIVSPSASPFVLGKHEKHRMICAEHARMHGRWVASVNQGGANDELVFDGHAMVFAPGGGLTACTALFGGEALMLDVEVKGRGAASVRGGGAGVTPARDEHLLFLALTTGIREYLRKCGFKSALLGLSGGIDSALTAALAVAAIGSENVLGVAMPSMYSSGHSVEDAYALAKNLGMRCVTVPIEEPMGGFRAVLDPMFRSEGLSTLGATLPDLTEENLQSRVRGTILMAISNRTGSIVLTTGNKSELAVGYCTLYGDMNGGLAVLSDVSKHWVYALSRWMNQNASMCGFAVPPIPLRSIEKAPSAELRPGQTDQDSLPAYPVLDEILRRYVEGRQNAGSVAKETGYDEGMVRKIVRMIDLSEYKRKQAAIGLKVTTVAFGSGRRWPVAQGWR